MNSEKIDVVITWGDGNDPKWLEEKSKYVTNDEDKKRRYCRQSEV